MKSIRTITLIIATLLGSGIVAAHAAEKNTEPKKQTTCPVMEGQPIEKSNYIDIKGYRIYVCCKGCTNQIKANPDKYIKRLKDQGVEIEKAPEKETK